jgi:hypothetical protein
MDRTRLFRTMTAGLACAAIAIVAPGCERKRSPLVAADPQSKDGAAKSAAAAPSKESPAPSKEALQALGAAAWLPRETAFYTARFRLAEQVEAVAKSRAFARIAALPLVQQALAQMRSHPEYEPILQQIRENPLVQDGVKLARDAFSNEVFLWGGEPCIDFQNAVAAVYGNLFLHGMREAGASHPSSDEAVPRILVASILEHQKALRCPPIVAGFRLSKPDEARSYLENAMGRLEGTLPFAREKIHEHDARVLRVSGKMIPEPEWEQLLRGFRSQGVPRGDIEKLRAWIESLTLAIAVLVRNDYLIVSLGPDTKHLERLGDDRPLAGAKAFGPLFSRLGKRLVSLGYIDPRLILNGKIEGVPETARGIREIVESLPPGKVPEGLPARVEKDARAFIEDLNRFLPDPAPIVMASFLEKGLETFTFLARGTSGLESGKPLGIASRAGPSPAAAAASRPRPRIEEYRTLARWAKTAYAYFEEYGVPTIPESERGDFEKFRKVFLPAIAELHEITETLLLPAIDGGEELLVLDTDGVLGFWPVDGRKLERPLRYPRPALAIDVNDPEKLRTACSRYREALNRFFARASKELGGNEFQIPTPITRPHAGGELYTYPLRTPLGPDFEPHAVLREKHLVLSLFPAQSKAMLESTWDPPRGPVPLGAASGRVVRADVERWTRLLFEDLGVLVDELAREGLFPGDQVPLLRLHLGGLGDALRAVRTYTARTYEDEGVEVHHSWLEIRDIEDA